MDIKQAKIAMRNARCDLALAINYPDLEIYKRRCRWSIEHITRVLNDAEEFAKTERRWKKETENG